MPNKTLHDLNNVAAILGMTLSQVQQELPKFISLYTQAIHEQALADPVPMAQLETLQATYNSFWAQLLEIAGNEKGHMKKATSAVPKQF